MYSFRVHDASIAKCPQNELHRGKELLMAANCSHLWTAELMMILNTLNNLLGTYIVEKQTNNFIDGRRVFFNL